MTVDEYLDAVPEPARSTLEKVRSTIRSVMPAGHTEEIRYRIPTFQYNGGIVGYAAFPKHCSLYTMSLGVMAAFQDQLGAYETGKGTIQFALDKPLPAALVKKIVKARLEENALLKSARKKR